MDPQLQQALARVLDEMIKAAEAIGVQGVRLWPQLVGITFVKSVAWSVFIPLLWITGTITIWSVFKWLRAADTNMRPGSEDKGFPTFFGLVCIAGWVCVVLATFSVFTEHLAGVFFPEAATVLDLLARAGAATKK